MKDIAIEKPFLVDRIKKAYNEEYVEIIKGFNEDRLLTLRVNTNKSDRQEIIDFFNSKKIEYKVVDWYDNAFIVETNNEKEIFDSDIFNNGKIYIQSLSSMLPAIIMNPKDNTDILDMTSAPGGKSTLMSNIAPKSRITCYEKDKIRAEKLKHNISLQGAKNCFVMVGDATKIEDYYKFDNILLDSPCSGSGTIMIKNEKTYDYFSEKLLSNLKITQKKLLEKAITLTKKGGTIVYSTCSILPEENEDIIQPFINQNKVKIEKIKDYNIPLLPCKIDGAICVKPTQYYEGFFVCKMIKC